MADQDIAPPEGATEIQDLAPPPGATEITDPNWQPTVKTEQSTKTDQSKTDERHPTSLDELVESAERGIGHLGALWQGAKETGDPRVWWEGLKRLYNNPSEIPSALWNMPGAVPDVFGKLPILGTPGGFEEFSKGAGGDPWRAAGQVGAAAAWAGAGKIAEGLLGGIGKTGQAAAEAAPETPGYSRWKPGALNAEKPAPPPPPPPAEPAPKPLTPAQRVSQAMSKVSPVAETLHFVPYMGWVPYLTNAVKVGADLAAKHWGWAEGGTVLDRAPSREEILRSLR